MNNNEEIARLWSEIMKSLADSEAPSGGGDRDSVGRKRPADSRRERKRNRVKRQCVSKLSDKSHHNLSKKKRERDLIRSKLETLRQITPNCPKTDLVSMLDSVIEYTSSLQLATFLTALCNLPDA